MKKKKEEKEKKENQDFIYRRYITRNGKRIYPKNGKVFKIPIKE